MRRELNFFSREQGQISVRWFKAYKILNQSHRLDTDKKGFVLTEQQQTETGAAFQVCAQSTVTLGGFGQGLHLPGPPLGFASLSERGHISHQCCMRGKQH